MAIKIRKRKLYEDDAQQQPSNDAQQAQPQQNNQQADQNQQQAQQPQQSAGQNQQQQQPNQNQNQDQNQQQNQQQQAPAISEEAVKNVNNAILEALTKATTEAFNANLAEWMKSEGAANVMNMWKTYTSQPTWESYIAFYKGFVEAAKQQNAQQAQGQQNNNQQAPGQQDAQQQQQPNESYNYNEFAESLNERVYFHQLGLINVFD